MELRSRHCPGLDLALHTPQPTVADLRRSRGQGGVSLHESPLSESSICWSPVLLGLGFMSEEVMRSTIAKTLWVSLVVGLLCAAGSAAQSPVPPRESARPASDEAIQSQIQEPQGTLLYFPDYVEGSGWSVQLVLSNVGATAATAVVEVYGQDGQSVTNLFDSGSRLEIPSSGESSPEKHRWGNDSARLDRGPDRTGLAQWIVDLSARRDGHRGGGGTGPTGRSLCPVRRGDERDRHGTGDLQTGRGHGDRVSDPRRSGERPDRRGPEMGEFPAMGSNPSGRVRERRYEVPAGFSGAPVPARCGRF